MSNARVETACAILLMVICLFGDAIVEWAVPTTAAERQEPACPGWAVCGE